MWILALADDLTGALETGAKFAAQGFSCEVRLGREFVIQPKTEVLVIDTETRHLPPIEAYSLIFQLAAAAAPLGPMLIYKKTDSTLRGNIAPEFRALLDVFPNRSLTYAPAYPELDRVVRGGVLFVSGQPVHLTPFALDPLNPVSESDIRVMLAGLPVTVLDGEDPSDVETAARAILAGTEPRLAAGPASLAGALARSLRPHLSPQGWPKIRSCLIVNGSRHPVSALQIQHAQRQSQFDRVAFFEGNAEGSGMERAHRTAALVKDRLAEQRVDALIVFGGDTAYAIHRALGGGSFQPHGEILPGVPVANCGQWTWITKAGGFGDPDVLVQIWGKL